MRKIFLSTTYYLDDKLAGCSAATERMFSRLLALAGQIEESGKLPPNCWTAVGLPRGKAQVDDLVERGIITPISGGKLGYVWEAWGNWNEESNRIIDKKKSGAERARRYRENKKAREARVTRDDRDDRNPAPMLFADPENVKSVSKPGRNGNTFDTRATREQHVVDTSSTAVTADEQAIVNNVTRDASQAVTPLEEGEEIVGTYVPTRSHLSSDDENVHETRGSLALVPTLPDRLPNGRKIPKQTRHQMLANLNATARSQAADQLVRQFETTLDGKLDRGTMFEVARVIDTLIAEGLPPQQIANGLVDWHASDRLYPSQIPRFVAKAARSTHRRTNSTTDQRIAEAQNLTRPEWDELE